VKQNLIFNAYFILCNCGSRLSAHEFIDTGNQTMLNKNCTGTNDRELLEFLDASSPATQHQNDKVSNLSEMTFNSIICNISECNYYDIPNIDFPLSSYNNQLH